MTIKEIDKYDNFIVSIGKFLSHFCYINSSNANKLSHEAFMEIFDIEGLNPKSIRLEDVLCGDIILVSDVYDRVFGYKNPLLIRTEDEEEYFINNFEFEIEDKKTIDLKGKKIEELTDYELDKLLIESKKLKDERIKHKIIKELRFRPESKPGAKQTLIEKVRKREFFRIKRKEDMK